MTAGPLEDLTIVAVTEYGAGPFSSQLLAELGATVIKLEAPAGDSSRRIPPYQQGTSSLFFESLNRSTSSVCVDLKHPDGQRILKDLAAKSDAVFSNLRADAVSRLGLRYDQLRESNPALVCCFLTGWGLSGPRSGDPAYDYGVQAFTGHMALNGEPHQPPGRSGAPWVDFGTGTAAAFALLAGVHRARITGRGQDVDVSMINFAMSMWGYMATWFLTAGLVPERQRMSGHQSVVPSQIFPTADGHVVVMCQTDQFWRLLCAGLELHHLPEEPRYSTFAGRLEHRHELVPVLETAFAAKSTEYWLGRLTGRIPIEPVHSFSEAFDVFEKLQPQHIVTIDHPELGVYRTVATPMDFADGLPPPRRAPRLGEHTRQVLREVAGYTEDEVLRLIQSGVVQDRKDSP
jgi:crotonobetainyl-CoA:carnitine CoA-transferase CaiB-like acyl-CoA transferase